MKENGQKYIEVYSNLKKSINEKGQSSLFLKSIKDLKYIFGENVSTKFLAGLSDLDNPRKRTKRISYLLRKNKLKTRRDLRFYNTEGARNHKAEITVWGHDKNNLPFNQFVGVDESEDMQKTRDAFNYGGGAVIRDCKVVHVSSYLIVGREEVLYMVVC